MPFATRIILVGSGLPKIDHSDGFRASPEKSCMSSYHVAHGVGALFAKREVYNPPEHPAMVAHRTRWIGVL